MKLNNLKITSFRNIKDLEFDFDDLNFIQGKNALGKTSIIDSIMWLLCDETYVYGKSNEDNKDKNNTRNPIVIECKMTKDNGNTLELKREYFEKWKINDETNEEEFVRIENKFYINGATYKANDYFDRIRNEIGIKYDTKVKTFNLLRCLIDYSYLSNIDYKIARKFIEEMLDLISDNDLVQDNQFKNIKEYLIAQNFDIVKTKSSFKNSLEKFQIGIDNLEKELEIKKESIKNNDFSKYEQLCKEKENVLNENINSNVDFSHLQELLQEKGKLIQVEEENALKGKKEQQDKVNNLIAQGNKLVSEIELQKSKRNNEYNNIKNAKNLVELINEKIESARSLYNEIKAQEFKAIECPNCHYELNGNEKQMFDDDKKERLEKAKNKGLVSKKELEAQKEIINQSEKNVVEINCVIETKEKEIFSKREEYQAENKKLSEINIDNSKLLTLNQEQEKVKNDISNFINTYNVNKQNKLLELQKEITKLDTLNFTKKEIENIESNLNGLKSGKANAELQIVILEEFKQKKLQNIRDNTSKVFPNVEFEMLYESPTTGALNDCCYPMYKNVEFKGLNDGNKYPLGIEVIEDIKRKLNVTEDLPIIFDRKADIDDENFKKCLKLTKSQIFATEVTKDKEIKVVKENRQNGAK